MTTDKLLYKDLTYQIRGVAFAVYNELGFGHKENIYQRAFAHELSKRKITFEKERRLPVLYDNTQVGI